MDFDFTPFLTTIGPFALGVATLMAHNRVRRSESRKNNATAETGLADSMHKWLTVAIERAEKAELLADKHRQEAHAQRGRVGAWRGYGQAAHRVLLANNLTPPEPSSYGLTPEDFY